MAVGRGLWDRARGYRGSRHGAHRKRGFIMLGVDYYSAPHVTIDLRRSSPYEIGLDRCVKLDRGSFMGQEALRAEAARGAEWKMVGVEADWLDLERLSTRATIFLRGSRRPRAASAVPLYSDGKFVGQVTSTVWSPLLKRTSALQASRRNTQGSARSSGSSTRALRAKDGHSNVVERPFFEPERKRTP